MTRISEEFREELKKHNIKELARKTGLNYHTIYGYRDGTMKPSLENAQIVADAMGLEFLLFEKEE